MNILFFQDTLGVSGGEIWMADAAVKLREKGHGVAMGCPSGSWMERRAESLDLPYFSYLPEGEFEGHLRWRLCETLEEEAIDVICCGIPGIRCEVPLLDAAIREVGHGRIVLRLGITPGKGAPLSPKRLGLGFETVSGIVVVSQDIKARLQLEYPGLADRIHVLYNGVDTDAFDPGRFTTADRRAFKASLDIPEHHHVIGAVGRLDPVKNLPMLIQAAGRVLSHFPNTTFVIAGEGAEKQNLIEAARQAGVLGRFRFPGFVADMPRLLHGLDVLTHTSFSEGVPNAVLEAMAMGKPVIATAVGGVPELIESGKTGILIPSNDAENLAWTLCDLLQNPQKQIDLGRTARAQAETALNRRAKMDAVEALFVDVADRAKAAPVALSAEMPVLYDLPDFAIKSPFAFSRMH